MANDFADRDGWIWVDGDIVPWRDAKCHVLNHTMHYASGIFEGIRAYNGKSFKLDEHLVRLAESARLLGYALPHSLEVLRAATQTVLEANGLRDAYIRPFAWRGSEQMSVSAPASRIHVAIAAWSMPAYFQKDGAEAGVKLALSSWQRQAPTMAPLQAKAAGLYMAGTLAKHAALDEGYDDALMMDWQGNVAEATAANIFTMIDGTLVTPIADAFLNGITRQTVIEIARSRGLTVSEERLPLEKLLTAQEIFVTGTAAEIVPVSRIGSMTFNLGPTTRDLLEAYQALVRA
ncbi:branched-chain amino acid aminotransferase [Ensifer adhaerens]|uniref:branched-chain amino acid aminotransferase n=1 Tax=Ensifer adhaerens TaxID=106592 RepID=UPI001CBE3CA6|nr:branched-chain amino acid aminotransferase [Ensifer adhaerens]MBZ7924341.1 branched-chain amino acid aminotransferase [Ensifer adhaerens]UAX96410.1 branched-chain amino acid aminotransferase [Ensifer adhaerens]UAY04247.1 branched-chain amino acid aminotransferase [Ensifer adhaerens]UAY12233.1 branched-chain amino acid aminotransferase [Ensifer adhaerens]